VWCCCAVLCCTVLCCAVLCCAVLWGFIGIPGFTVLICACWRVDFGDRLSFAPCGCCALLLRPVAVAGVVGIVWILVVALLPCCLSAPATSIWLYVAGAVGMWVVGKAPTQVISQAAIQPAQNEHTHEFWPRNSTVCWPMLMRGMLELSAAADPCCG
jgi:hypothetical protein